MKMALWVKGIILLTCLEGYIASNPFHNWTMNEVIKQLHSLNKNPKVVSCNSSLVWQVNFKEPSCISSIAGQNKFKKLCAALEVLNNITDCPHINPVKRNMKLLLGNSTWNDTCLEVQDTKIQLTKFLGNLLQFLRNIYRNDGIC